MKICKFEDLQIYLKKNQKKTSYRVGNFFLYKKKQKISTSWSQEIHERLGIWDFFFSWFPFEPFPMSICYLRPQKFFEYDSQRFVQEKGNALNTPEILAFLIQSIHLVPKKLLVKPDFMNYQPDINGKMRAILVDWLIDVHNKFKLIPKTLHLTVNILDRFLGQKSLVRQKLQLLGITSMLLASKHEEIYAPETQDFVYISDKSYTKDDIFKMETLICSTLKYRFSQISSLVFLSCWLKFFRTDQNKIIFSIYCIDLTLLDLSIMKFPPKTIAASATLVMLETLSFPFDRRDDKEIKTFYRKFSINQSELEECSDILKSFLILNQNGKRRLTSLKRKYSSKKYKEISNALFSISF